MSGLISQSVTSRLPPDQSHLFLLPSPHLLAAATQDPGGFTCAIGPPCHPGTCNQPLVHSFRHSQDSSALLPANINSRLILQRFRGKYEYIYIVSHVYAPGAEHNLLPMLICAVVLHMCRIPKGKKPKNQRQTEN
ncbi:hypothetical protein J3E69DRAFT_157667 [Trichoderma sp. SZMC 28015]